MVLLLAALFLAMLRWGMGSTWVAGGRRGVVLTERVRLACPPRVLAVQRRTLLPKTHPDQRSRPMWRSCIQWESRWGWLLRRTWRV